MPIAQNSSFALTICGFFICVNTMQNEYGSIYCIKKLNNGWKFIERFTCLLRYKILIVIRNCRNSICLFILAFNMVSVGKSKECRLQIDYVETITES